MTARRARLVAVAGITSALALAGCGSHDVHPALSGDPVTTTTTTTFAPDETTTTAPGASTSTTEASSTGSSTTSTTEGTESTRGE